MSSNIASINRPSLLVRVVGAVKRAVPAGTKQFIRNRLHESSWLGTQYQCPICETGLSRFDPMPAYFFDEWQRHQYIHSIFAEETLSLDQFSCPCCGALDRERLIALHCGAVFQNGTGGRLLEFAPTPALSAFLKAQPVEYRSADLCNPRADDAVDITDLRLYCDSAFDVFICSHVLEHVVDDRKALSELFRVLSPGGWGVVMVPVNLALASTHEDPAVSSDAERWRQFGQHDHVRVYSKSGFLSRLREAGFEVRQLGVTHFGAAAFRRHGIQSRSILYVVDKPAARAATA